MICHNYDTVIHSNCVIHVEWSSESSEIYEIIYLIDIKWTLMQAQ